MPCHLFSRRSSSSGMVALGEQGSVLHLNRNFLGRTGFPWVRPPSCATLSCPKLLKMANLARMRRFGLQLTLACCLGHVLACAGGPDDDDNGLRPKIGGPISDFPVRGPVGFDGGPP